MKTLCLLSEETSSSSASSNSKSRRKVGWRFRNKAAFVMLFVAAVPLILFFFRTTQRFETLPESSSVVVTKSYNNVTTKTTTKTPSSFSSYKKSRICVYDGSLNIQSTQCYKMLFPHLKSKPAWHFMGDSQMGILMDNLKYPYGVYKKHVSKGRCGFLEYVGMPKRSEWVPPNETQGPLHYGLKNHFCPDSWQLNQIVYAPPPSNDNQSGAPEEDPDEDDYFGGALGSSNSQQQQQPPGRFVEYLVVNFANDVEHQTPATATSQETVAVYLEHQLKSHAIGKADSVCVVNTGLHDQAIGKTLGWSPGKRLAVYANNVEWYLGLLSRVCGTIVWIGTTHVSSTGTEYVQKNDVTLKWNEAVKGLLESHHATKSFYVDTWNVSSGCEHRDHVHFLPGCYYEPLADLFTALM